MLISVNGVHEGILPVYAGSALTTVALNPAQYVSLKNVNWVTVLVEIMNATTVTGRAVTLKQATAVAGTGVKALAFSRMWQNIDCAAGNVLAETAVTSNTFTSDTTNSKRLLYVIEVDPATLDTANSFDCFAVDVTAGAASGVDVVYLLSMKYAAPTHPSVIAD